jgi:hypothetical protein
MFFCSDRGALSFFIFYSLYVGVTKRAQRRSPKSLTILVFTYLDSMEGAKLLELRMPPIFEAYRVSASCPVNIFCLSLEAPFRPLKFARMQMTNSAGTPSRRLPWT